MKEWGARSRFLNVVRDVNEGSHASECKSRPDRNVEECHLANNWHYIIIKSANKAYRDFKYEIHHNETWIGVITKYDAGTCFCAIYPPLKGTYYLCGLYHYNYRSPAFLTEFESSFCVDWECKPISNVACAHPAVVSGYTILILLSFMYRPFQ